MLHTTTNSGLHDFVGERVLTRYGRPGVRAADLGAGHGYQLTRKPIAWALRLSASAFSGDALLGENHILVMEPLS
jgi:hypothetical protein